MVFYDLIHGYQPLIEKFIPDFVAKNLREIFLPTSSAMKKGLVRRGIQMQGWTVDTLLVVPRFKNIAKKIFQNLKIANQKKNIEVGISAYSHPILPMLSDDLIYSQIILDREMVENNLGRATWFWPPEGAVDQRVLKIIHQAAPDLIILMPDKCLGRYNFSGPIKLKFSDSSCQKVLAFNCLLKDIFMNAGDYRVRPDYMQYPNTLIWEKIKKIASQPKILKAVLDEMGQSFYILMRDWENAGSKTGLKKIGAAKEIAAFYKNKDLKFCLPSQIDWPKATIFPINKIIPASWDMESTPADPYPWWLPNEKGKIWRTRSKNAKKMLKKWQALICEMDRLVSKKIKTRGGVKAALKDEEFKIFLKKIFPGFHSCVAWHLFAKKDWHPDYGYSLKAMEKVVLPSIDKENLD